MKRLPMTGTALVSGEFNETDLKLALDRLKVGITFSGADVREMYFQFGKLSGAWLANEESKEASSVASALGQAGKYLAKVSQLLSGHETGMKTTTEIFATTLVCQRLTVSSTANLDAREFISRFREDATQVGKACAEVSIDLSQKSSIGGRQPLLWHDDFTNLLLNMAKKGGIEPTLHARLAEAEQRLKKLIAQGL